MTNTKKNETPIKRCAWCWNWYPHSNFWKHKNKLYGLQPSCKKCFIWYTKMYLRRNKKSRLKRKATLKIIRRRFYLKNQEKEKKRNREYQRIYTLDPEKKEKRRQRSIKYKIRQKRLKELTKKRGKK